MNMATFVGRYLAARGVKRAFGHPGSDVMDLIDGFEQAGIDFILTHHENSGAFMASVGGLLTGVPGVVVVTKGPGVTNVASGVAAATLDRAPLLCFSSHIGADRAKTYVHQHLDVLAAFRPISKLAAELTAANAHHLLPEAVRIARADRPGAAYLPSTAPQQTREMPAPEAELEEIIRRPIPPERLPAPDIAPAARLVAGARRLMLVVGPGVNPLPANSPLLQLIDRLGAPVAVTPEAVGQVPADHPLYAGMYAWYDASLQQLLKDADVVLTVGVDGWDMLHSYSGPARIVSLAAAEASDPTFQPVEYALEGDLPALMQALGARGTGPREWGRETAEASRAAIGKSLAVSGEHREADGVPPQRALAELRAICPRETIFCCDVGAHKSMSCALWPAYAPRTFVTSNGLSPMGYGLPAAMGAKLACPERPVVAVVGDGGLLMYAGEMATWARLKLPLTLVVMVDGHLTQVRRRQERRGYSLKSSTFQRVDFAALAKSLGIDALTATTSAEYRAAVEKAVAANRPVLVEAVLDGMEYRRSPEAP
jgi:acetolactate synthase-1/2/3 large subunit